MRRDLAWLGGGILVGALFAFLLGPGPHAVPVRDGSSALPSESSEVPAPLTVPRSQPSLAVRQPTPAADASSGSDTSSEESPARMSAAFRTEQLSIASSLKAFLDAAGVDPGNADLSWVFRSVLSLAHAKGPKPASDDVALWLRSRDSEDLHRGIGWALRVDPPRIDELLTLARDRSQGVHAAAALYVLASDAAGREHIRGDLDQLVRHDDPMIQRTAYMILPRFDKHGVSVAVTAARRGELSASAFAVVTKGVDAKARRRLIETILDNPSSSAALLRSVLEKDAGAIASDPRLHRLVERLAHRHFDPWVRETAQRQVAVVEAAESGSLFIRSAFYGARGRVVDVTDALRKRVADGRLDTRAGNDLGGDPVFGVVKDLVVEYEVGRHRYTRSVREGQRIRLP